MGTVPSLGVTVCEVPGPTPIPDDLAKALDAVGRRREAQQKRRETTDQEAQALVVLASDLGCSIRQVAKLLRMSHVAAAKLERRAREGGSA